MYRTDKYGFEMKTGDKIDINNAEIIEIDDDFTVHLKTEDGYFLMLKINNGQ